MTRTDWLERHALYTPDHPAIVWAPTGRKYSYAELHTRATRLAATLIKRHDLSPGDRVAVLAENAVEHVLLFLAAQTAGFVLVPLNFRLALPELQYVVTDAEPSLIFVGADYADTVTDLDTPADLLPLDEVFALSETNDALTPVPRAELPPQPGLDDPVMILYTSGTTGRPKGAIISHGMIAWNSVNTEMRLDLTSNDRSFNAAPFYHTGGWNVLLTPFLHHGATTFLLPSFDPEAILRLCDDEELTILWGVPTMLKMMSDHPAFDEVTLESVRYAIVGGEAMPEPLIRVWQDKGVPIRQGFGMTEVGVNCFSLPEKDALRKIGSIGFPNFYIDTRVVDEDGNDVAANTTGELLMRGPVVTPGYWRNPEATAEAIDEDGWFATGDLVRVDDEGYFYVVGRKKEMYISGGENVYPAEVETALYEHPAVAEAAVIGVPDDTWGETGAAFIALKEGQSLTEDELLAHARSHLARYKVPRHVRFLDELPKGHSGKIQKSELADRFAPA
ncbi:AMP-dependent synthetase [Longibacter salinarum]|uniref:AMP-dependent synthetase n=1 Tax=Longibacter salinarum TaxID=1850348 RepID=A0A2A8CUH1_9BACT|nr:long-chain fatty acid--CoA ligase [Longibacter salinarum]PEN12256.1 AMP-dependent synthetase [Longibacter salinarum]